MIANYIFLIENFLFKLDWILSKRPPCILFYYKFDSNSLPAKK